MKKVRRLLCTIGVVLMAVTALAGCNLLSEEKVKLRDLEMTVLSEDKIPAELKNIIDEKKGQPFQLTYKDEGNLYICIGYGEQSTGGYSVVVNELYLTDSSVCVNTSLLGPESANRDNQVPSYPFIVIKTELLENPVIFE